MENPTKLSGLSLTDNSCMACYYMTMKSSSKVCTFTELLRLIQNVMKPASSLLIGLVAFATTTAGIGQTVLGSYDFESGTVPPRFQGSTGSGAPNFSISSSFANDPGNRYGHYVVTVTNMYSNPSARWYAGSAILVPNLLTDNPPPPHWEVSFDIRQETLEPVFVQLVLGSSSFHSPTYTAWVTPPSSGWSHVSVFSEQFTQGLFGAGISPTQLWIGLSSHDGDGNPLAITSIGSHAFDLDNMVISVVPEPASASVMVFGLLGMAVFLKKREAE